MASQPELTARRYIGGETRRTVLPGGLRVATEDIPGSHTFSIGVFVEAGSRHESAPLHGACHFLEHVLFKGTKTRTPQQLSAAIEEVGGDINAYTTKEYTCFHAKVLADHAEIALGVLTDMIADSVIRADDLEAEREVIRDEIAMHNDDPYEVAAELVAQKLYAGTSLARSVAGTDASIRGLSRDQVVSFWKRHYGSPSLIIAAAGRVDHDWLVAQVAELDERLAKRGRAPRAKRVTAVQGEPAVCLHKRPFEHSTALLAFGTPGLYAADGSIDERRYALNLLAMILGGGMSSRLFVEVRERRALTYSIDAAEAAYDDAGMFTVEWGCAPERVPDILEVVRATISDVIDHGVTAEELVRAKGQMRGQMMLGYETPASRMGRLGTAELSGDPRTVAEILDRYSQVPVEQLQSVAADLLAQPPVLAVVGALGSRSRLQTIVNRWPDAGRSTPQGGPDD